MTSKSPVHDMAFETIKHLLTQKDEMLASEINQLVSAITGLDTKQAGHQLYISFTKGKVRRKEGDAYNANAYRLTSRFPNWGESHRDFTKRTNKVYRKKKSGVIEMYKANSKIYQFDQLLRGAHAV